LMVDCGCGEIGRNLTNPEAAFGHRNSP